MSDKEKETSLSPQEIEFDGGKDARDATSTK